MAAIGYRLSPLDLNTNAALLWKFPEGPLFADYQLLRRQSPNWSSWLGRIIFWIKDWWSKGEETRKVEALVSATLNNMLMMMDEPDSHWHFSVNTFKEGAEIVWAEFFTYDMLADKILARSPFESAKAAARLVKEAFNRINFTEYREGITKEDVIFSRLTYVDIAEGHHELEGPSLLRYIRLKDRISPELLRETIEQIEKQWQ